MPRQPKPAELTLQAKSGTHAAPNSSPINLEGVDLGSFGGGFEHDIAAGLTPLPKDLPQSPLSPRIAQSSKESKEPGRGFLGSLKSRIASEQEQKRDTRQPKDREDEYRPNTSSMSKIYHLRNNPGSTPELSLVGSNENVRKDSIESEKPSLPTRPQPSHQASEESTTSRRKDKSFRIGITRSKSIRRDSHSKSRPMNGKDSFEAPPNTAPLQSDWPGSDARAIGKGKEKDRRGKSAERAPSHYESEENLSMSYPKSNKESKGGFKAGSKNVMSKAKSGGGNFLNRLGKIGRSTSNNEKDVPDNEYTMKVINLPLVEQTRITRISKQLSGCRDKTEYWMPSLPWRCIDFLNTNAEEEGLYRIPGSGPKVKHWQRRFDSELDIDLLSEEVTDTNEIASMLKAWLRELPTEMMPASLQKSLAVQLEKENPNYKNVGQPASQLLRDCLSDLPPYNYYLLFAITCHLSLLLTNKDINKMDLNNLAVCVGPCLNLDRWLFNYLVGDWRHCWQGCYTEKDYLKVEEMVEAGVDPASIDSDQLTIGEFSDEKSLNQSLRTTTLSDDRSTNRSEWATTAGGNSDAGSTLDSRAVSSGSGSAASKPNSNYGDSRSMSSDPYSSRRVENYQPLTYTPAGYSNGSYGLGIDPEAKRPSTAEQRHAPEEGTIRGNGNGGGTKVRSDSTTPRVGHGRSRSDLPSSPAQENQASDWY